MKSLRSLVLAGALAVAGFAGAGSANAMSPLGAEFAPQATTADSGVQQAYYGHNRLCYMPFFRLVRIFGYYQARKIKFRCRYMHFGNYYGY